MRLQQNCEKEIDSCLAYRVLRNPEEWIGDPSPWFLESFLAGTSLRASYVNSDLPGWQIHGVLEDPDFYQPFVDATGHPTLTIRWASALDLTDFSRTTAFAKLRESALAWHRKHGVRPPREVGAWSPIPNPDEFWEGVLMRPATYMGKSDGWSLFCFLTGMGRGGDWLGLLEMPRLREIFGKIKMRSEASYGSPFGAFRMYDARDLLEWGLAKD